MTRFVFGIPLRSRATAKSWDTVSQLFDATLHSVLGQTDGDFQVIVACHELPDVPALTDPRVVIVRAPFPPPPSLSEQPTDKRLKRWLIAMALRELGGGYIMFVDADDLVSNRLVAFARQDAHPHGYILRDGYEFDCAIRQIRPSPRFNRICGSSAIIRFDTHELPDSLDDQRPCYYSQFPNHVHWEEVAAAHGRQLKPLPFRGVVYVINNGENWSAQTGNIGWKRQLLRRMRGAAPSPVLRSEFGLALR